MLWDYIRLVVSNWDGQVVIMGDFNEVEYISERLSAVALDRFLSNHRPILMREFHEWGHETLMKKLKMLKDKIRGWINIYKEGVKSGKRTLKSDLNSINAKIDRGEGDDNDINRRLEIIRLIQGIDKVDSMEMAQKTKIKWAIDGDKNSKYYHGVINKKRGRCAVRGVLADGMWVDAPNAVKMEFFEHFKVRFGKPSNCGIKLERDFPNRISSDQNEFLESEVTNKEIKEAVWDCGIDKTPGPDGFTFGFFRRFWSFIEKDVVAAIRWFFETGKIPKGGNSSFITLIPKIPNANMVKDYRPISLIGSVYKIIAKILANRLTTVLGDLVNEIQSAFVKDRQILDGPFILNELMQWCKSKKKQTMVFKVDFEKAYDSIRWDFLDDVMKKFGFGEIWCNWIQSCLQTSRGSVLVNGSPTQEFQFHKGYKQATRPRTWNQDNIDTLIHVLDIFHRASGLRINMSKSKLLGICVEANNLKYAAEKIGCSILKTPFTYLGARVGAQMSRINAWKEITDGMVSRLSKWKVKTLSIGGRLTLLKSVLGATPIYHMSIFKAPMKVLQNMKAIRARFFNGADLNTRKACWVSWKRVLNSKDRGGLGVSSMFALNRALLFKWVWRFITHKNSMWVRVIKALHGSHGRIGSITNTSYPSVWLSILQEVEVLKSKCIDLLSFVTLVLGNGMKDIVVASKLAHNDLEKSLRRRPRGGCEQSQMEMLKSMLEGVSLNNSNDRWSWSLDGTGDFSVSSVRRHIDDHVLPSGNKKTRWIKEVPIKINIHAWKVSIDDLPTRFNLSRRGVEIDSIMCPLCDGHAALSFLIRDLLHFIPSCYVLSVWRSYYREKELYFCGGY
ncbi:RNA-directed DNA polymerase, eukaryota, reverse transcriptase zinc-binding domain protein [Tanacetum coccineum]